MLTRAEITAIEPLPSARSALSGESLFRAHFDSLPGPAYIWKRAGTDFVLLAYNRAAAAVNSNKVADYVGSTVRALQPMIRYEMLDELELAASRNMVIRREVDHRYIGGESVRRLALTFVPVSQDIVVVHADDVTARRRAEEALRESEMRVRALLHAHPDLIIRVTRDGRYLDMHCTDKRVPRHLTCSPEQLIGTNVADHFDAAFARQHERLRRRALATGEVQRWEYARTVNGADFYLEARFVKSGEDEVVVTVRDITQRVELEREVIASSERERTRIGHDLHDGLAQLLVGVKLMLASLKDKLAAGGSRHAQDASRAVDLVTRAISQTSELAQGLSPIRKGGRLNDALKQLASQSEQLLGVRCSIDARDLPANLEESTATHLYRIIQEAITNAVKHGGAAAVEVACKREKARLLVTIADDGAGITELASERGGMGTHIMRYRAHGIGGDLTIAARAEGGTLVTCVCPWPPASAASAKEPGAD